jgi:hypothetical protein
MNHERLTAALRAGDAGEIRHAANVIEYLESENSRLTQLHQLDMAEIVRLRRMVEAVGEGRL